MPARDRSSGSRRTRSPSSATASELAAWPLIAGVVGLLAVGMLVYHSRDSGVDSLSPALPEAATRAAGSNGASGWIARPEEADRSGAGTAARSRSATGVTSGTTGTRRGPGSSETTGATSGARQAMRRDDSRRSGSLSNSHAVESGMPVSSAVPIRETDTFRRSREVLATEMERRRREGPTETEEAAVAAFRDDGIIYDSGAEARFPTAQRFEVPETGGITGQTGTISFQFEPGWSGENQADASLVEIGDGRFVIRKNVSFLRFEMTGDNGAETSTGFSMADWQPGQRYQITTTWNGGMMQIYVDGKMAAQQYYTNPFEIPAGTPTYVGTDPQPAPVAPGVLSNLRLSNEALGPGEIASLAAEASQKTN